MNKGTGKNSAAEMEKIADETLPETYIRTQALLSRRKRLEKIQQEKDFFVDLKELAEFETEQAQAFIKECKNLLRSNLATGVKTDWASLYNDKPYPPFVYKSHAPQYNQISKEKGVPQKNFLSELLFPATKKARLKKEKEAQATYNLKVGQHEADQKAKRAAYEKDRDAYIARQSAYNSRVEALQLDFEKGHPKAMESYARIALLGAKMPDLLNVYFDTVYLPREKQLIIDCLLPAYYDVPRVLNYQCSKDGRTIEPTVMTDEEFDTFYRDLIRQIALTAINTAFTAIPTRHLKKVGFNGWVDNDKIDDTLESKVCIITCQTGRERFAGLDLLKFPAADSIHQLGGLTAGSISGTETIRPIVSYEPSPETTATRRQAADNPKKGRQSPQYQPGEFRIATTELVDEVMDQIEKNLLFTAGKKDETLH
ncbi:MAG: hypothetical protein GX325_01265 [Peptococcaceae bacterium]|nr:hypothetical protein [Peptococcaceae bacterium]